MNLSIFGAAAQAACKGDFFIFPHWYKYLSATPPPDCAPQISSLSDIWLIVAAVVEIGLRVAALVAVVFVIYGGFSYVTSQGEPEATGRAKGTIINALVGLAVAVTAAAIVSFIAKSIHS